MSTDPSTTESRQPTCEERISDHMASREAQFAALLDPDSLEDDDVFEAFKKYDELDARDTAIVAEWKRRYEAWNGEGHFDAGTMPDPDLTPEELAEVGEDDLLDVDSEYDSILDRARDTLRDRGQENLDEELLGVDIKRVVTIRIDLSTGGPADFITAEVDPEDGRVYDATYHFQDWFDGATRGIGHGDSLYSLVEYYAGMVETEPREPRY